MLINMNRNNLGKEKGVHFGSQLEGIQYMIMGKARQLEKEEAGHIANAIRKQTEMNGGQLALLF